MEVNMAKRLLVSLMILGIIFLMGCEEATVDVPKSGRGTAYYLTHNNTVGYADVTVLDGKVIAIELDDLLGPAMWTRVDTTIADNVPVTVRGTSSYANYIRIGDDIFTLTGAGTDNATAGTAAVYTGKILGKDIDNLLAYFTVNEANRTARTQAELKWYADACRAEKPRLAFMNKVGDNYVLVDQRPIASEVFNMSKRESSYWKIDESAADNPSLADTDISIPLFTDAAHMIGSDYEYTRGIMKPWDIIVDYAIKKNCNFPDKLADIAAKSAYNTTTGAQLARPSAQSPSTVYSSDPVNFALEDYSKAIFDKYDLLASRTYEFTKGKPDVLTGCSLAADFPAYLLVMRMAYKEAVK
jgi:hypothetical protein